MQTPNTVRIGLIGASMNMSRPIVETENSVQITWLRGTAENGELGSLRL